MEDKTLKLEREMQSLRLELQEQKKTTERLKQELERVRGAETPDWYRRSWRKCLAILPRRLANC
jgi:predicted RNase H-like nuclease (RuvC/YqgF family)